MSTLATIFCLAVLGARCLLTVAQTPTPDPSCGVFPHRRAKRVVGGHPVDPPYSWPFMCSVFDHTLGSPACGANLVKNTRGNFSLISSAHCFINEPDNLDRYSIRCALHTLSGDELHAQTLRLDSIILHPQFDLNTFQNDIAVIRLVSDPVENDTLMAVCLPSRPDHAGETGTVLGWGYTTEVGGSSEVLLEGDKPIISDHECTEKYGTNFHPETMLCAGHLTGGVDACSGDGGGPLIVQRQGVYELVGNVRKKDEGIVSWGYGCARPEYPGVYSDVYDLLPWVRTHMY